MLIYLRDFVKLQMMKNEITHISDNKNYSTLGNRNMHGMSFQHHEGKDPPKDYLRPRKI